MDLSSGSLPEMASKAGAGPTQNQEPELHLSLLYALYGPKYAGRLLLFSQEHWQEADL